ncbi:unnamed protein product [Ectocarpus sp. CCAP 1310/34]|nr:unnamed protein product [Ectocarpus sp. CCAP 1310/34]
MLRSPTLLAAAALRSGSRRRNCLLCVRHHRTIRPAQQLRQQQQPQQEQTRRQGACVTRRGLCSTPWRNGDTPRPALSTPSSAALGSSSPIAGTQQGEEPSRGKHSQQSGDGQQPQWHHHRSRHQRGAERRAQEGRTYASKNSSSWTRWHKLDDRNAGGEGRRRGEQTSDLVNPAIAKLLTLPRRRNDWREALRVLDDVEQQAAARGEASTRFWCRQGLSRDDGERARTRVYNIVMDILSSRNSSRWQEAFMLLETMQERGVTTDLYTLNSALKACGSAGQVELLLALLTEMRSSSRSNDDSGSNDNQRGDGNAATILLPAPDVVSFNIAIGACARAGEASLAVSLLDEMRAAAVADDSSPTAGDRVWAVGEGTARASPVPPPDRLSYNSTLSACGRAVTTDDAEWVQRALDILEAMRTGEDGAPSPDIVSYKEIVNACGRAGRWDQALSWVDAAVDAGLELTASVFCAIIIAFGRGGEWRRSLSVLYEDMPAYGVDPDKFCYNMALRACADAGQVKEALDILDQNLSGQRGVNAFSYSSIIDALARQGDAELGLRLLREIHVSTGYSPNAWHYGGVFLSFLKAGDETGALAIQSEWRDIQACNAREATERMRPGADRSFSANGDSSERRSRSGRTDPNSDKNGARSAKRGAAIQDPEGQRAVVELAAVAPGDHFQPLDLLCLAAFHADNGAWSECLDVLGTAQEVSRTARAAVRAKANELLLGRTERGEVIGNVGATTGFAGAGLASWRQVAAKNSEATERVDEASKALRGCYESAVEALGRAGRHKQALQAKEGASVTVKHGLSMDPACFVPALRSCCCNDTDSEDSGSEAGAATLGEMEARAGVVPDSWCTNVVMEAAIRDEQWSLASRLFDEAEKRHMSGHHDRGRGAGTSGDIADGDKSQRPAGPPGASDTRSCNRGPRELRKTAIDTMAPTALTYRLALQACIGAAQSNDMMAERALELVRKMVSDPHMGPRREAFLLAQQVCAKSAKMAVAVEIRQLETEAQDRHENDDFLRQWRERRSYRLKCAPCTLAR